MFDLATIRHRNATATRKARKLTSDKRKRIVDAAIQHARASGNEPLASAIIHQNAAA